MNGIRDLAILRSGNSNFTFKKPSTELFRFAVEESGHGLKRIFSIEVSNVRTYDQNRD